MTNALQDAVLFLLNDTGRRGDGPASHAAHKHIAAIAAEHASELEAPRALGEALEVTINAANASTLLSTLLAEANQAEASTEANEAPAEAAGDPPTSEC